MRGWNPDVFSENFRLRQECLNSCDLDIIGIAETHLYNNQNIELDGYVWFGQNRKKHIKAKKGSGGIGFLIKRNLLSSYNVEVVDSDTEGILWLCFNSKCNDDIFYSCVCYVPPSDSTRAIDLNEFYDALMYQVHSVCKDKFFFICGDFNARCGNLEDYIPGVDNLPERDVIDYCINKEGETLCNFLIDTNCCILNGRNHVENGYTYVGTQGSSVVDYCLIPYEALDRVKEFRVHLEKDLFNRSNLLGIIDPATSHPDHSLLTWEVKIEIRHQASVKQNENQISFVKFSRNYPQGFLNDCASELNISK